MATESKPPTREELADGLRVLVEVGRAIYQTIVEAGDLGAPESIVHLALGERGLSDRVARDIIEALLAGGLVERRHRALFAGEAVSGLAMAAESDAVLLSVQEDDFEPRVQTLAEFLDGYDYPEAQEDNARAIALQVGEQFAIDEGPLTRAPVWTITRIR